MKENRFLMDYLVLDVAYSFGRADADALFATNDKAEAIEAAKDFGARTVVVFINEKGVRTKIFIAPRSEVFISYIEGYYNRIRLHSGLNYQSPLGFEKHLELKNIRIGESFVS